MNLQEIFDTESKHLKCIPNDIRNVNQLYFYL